MKYKSLLFLLCMFLTVRTLAQTGTIYGRVTTADNQPVQLINVTLAETRQGAVTNENGFYRIQNIKSGEYTLKLSFTGDTRETKSIMVSPGANLELNFSLQESARQLAEVIVETSKIMSRGGQSANKLALDPLENAQVVHSISSVILKKQNAMTLEDAMKNAPGVTKLWDATSRPDGGSIFVSRGFQTTTKARNGLPNIVNTNVEMANLERIEVIKGPSATMFGSIISSYGGVINRVTKKPFFHNEGTVDVSYGSYNFYRAAADANVVVMKDKMAFRINAAGQNQDSWQDAGFQQSFIAAPSFLYKPNDRFTLNVDAEIVGSKGNSNGGNFVFILTPSMVNSQLGGLLAGLGVPENTAAGIIAQAPQTFNDAFGTDRVKDIKIDYNRSFLSNDVNTTTQSGAYFADATYKLSKHWTSQTVGTYSRSQNKGYTAYQYLIPNYVHAFIQSFTTTGTPAWGTPGSDSIGRMVWNPVGKVTTWNVQQNFMADYNFGKVRNRTVVGLDYARYSSHVDYNRFNGLLFGVAPLPDLFDVVATDGSSAHNGELNKANVDAAYANRQTSVLPYPQESGIFSGYVNNVANIGKYVIASAGLRVDNFKNKQNDREQTKLSPKFGLIVMPLQNKLSVFANYQNSFVNKFGVDKNGEAFVPEEAFQFETGVKYALFENKLSGSISYYNILAKNIIRIDPTNPQFDVQDGEQRSKGVEAEIMANPVKGWTVLFGYGYNKSLFEKANADVQGLRPVGSGPENTFNFWTNYTFTQHTLNGLGIGLSLNYAGESYAINQRPDGALILPSYAILGTHVTYDTQRFRLGLKVNNVTDQKYWMGWSSFIPQMRRQFIGTVSVKF